jgi:Xaa-Pro aminopeptidase
MGSSIESADVHARLRARRERLWDELRASGCNAGLVYASAEHPAAFRYLTDYCPPLGDMWGVVTNGGALACVLTFHWGLEEARRTSGVARWDGAFDPLPRVGDLLLDAAPRSVGVLGFDRLPAAALQRLTARLPGVAFHDRSGLIEAQRRRKDSLEIARLQQAAAVTEQALIAAVNDIRPGLCEREISARLAYEMQRAGAGLAFPPMTLAGGRDPVIFRPPTDIPIAEGDTVMIDVGAVVGGYQADIARTYVVGPPPAALTRAYSAVQEAHGAILEAIRPGVPCRTLHVAGAEALENAGYRVEHRMGHGVGLATSFEWPSLDTETEPLQEDMTLAIEPAVYEPGVGSVKLEDMVRVTADGFSFLSHASRSLRSIGLDEARSKGGSTP